MLAQTARPLGSYELPNGQHNNLPDSLEVVTMVAVKEFSWEEISGPDFGNPARHAWHEAVAQVE